MSSKRTDNSTSGQSAASKESGGSILGHIWASVAVSLILGLICCNIYPTVIWCIGQFFFPSQANGSLVKSDGTYTTKDEEAVGSALIGQPFTAPGYFHPRPSAANNAAGGSFSPTGGYDGTNSGGSNYGPLNDTFINGKTTSPTPPATQPAESLTFDGVRLRTIHYAYENKIPFKLYSVDGKGARTVVPLAKYLDSATHSILNDIKLVDDFPHPSSDAADRTVLIADDFATLIPGDAVTASGSGLDPHISPANAEIQKARVARERGVTPEQVEKLIAEHTDRPAFGVLGDPGVNVLMLNLALDNQYKMPKH